jgi:hypothetical protein
MSLISHYEATPNRVRALTRLVALLENATRSTLREHFMPEADSGAQFGNLLVETAHLGLIAEARNGQVSLNILLSPKEVADDRLFLLFVERALLSDESQQSENSGLRYALSWLLAQSPGTAIGWNSDQHLVMKEQMEGDNYYEVTNEGRFSMLCYWAQYLGYAVGLSLSGSAVVIPDPTEAIARRLEVIFAESTRLAIPRFFETLSQECPVLETGSVRRQVEDRMRSKRSEQVLSPATSLALWRLEGRGVIKLTHASDATTWLVSSSIASAGVGKARPISHIEVV